MYMKSAMTTPSPENDSSKADTDKQWEINRALRISEMRYRRLFESAQDGILLLNAETAQIEDMNPFLINMLGYSH